jgi:hypothetical protein
MALDLKLQPVTKLKDFCHSILAKIVKVSEGGIQDLSPPRKSIWQNLYEVAHPPQPSTHLTWEIRILCPNLPFEERILPSKQSYRDSLLINSNVAVCCRLNKTAFHFTPKIPLTFNSLIKFNK